MIDTWYSYRINICFGGNNPTGNGKKSAKEKETKAKGQEPEEPEEIPATQVTVEDESEEEDAMQGLEQGEEEQTVEEDPEVQVEVEARMVHPDELQTLEFQLHDPAIESFWRVNDVQEKTDSIKESQKMGEIKEDTKGADEIELASQFVSDEEKKEETRGTFQDTKH